MFDFEKISASKFYVAPTVERVVEFSPPGIDMDNISKVLSLAVDAKCNEAVAYDKYVLCNGRTSFRLTYLDAQGDAKGVEYNADFSVRADGDFTSDDSVSCDIRIVESDVQASDGLKLSAVIETVASAIRREEIETLVDADDCYKTSKEIVLPTFIASKTLVLPFEDESETVGEISNVLGLSVSATVVDASCKDGSVAFSAKAIGTVTYVENSHIRQKDFVMDLGDELLVDGVTDGDKVKATVTVKTAKVVLQGVTDDNVIKLEGEAAFKIQVFRSTPVSVVDDLFSLKNEVEIETKEFDYLHYDGCGYFTEQIAGSAMLGDNRAAAIEIAALPYARCYTSRAFVDDDGRLVVEGIVNTDIIYTDENGYNSVRTEIPFSISVQSEKPLSKVIAVKCSVERISAKIKKEREFDIDISLGIEVCGYSQIGGNYISAVQVGEEKPQNNSALSLYIANEGDMLIDLSKFLSAMPDEILKQNPSLEFPLKEGDRVVYFRRLAEE